MIEVNNSRNNLVVDLGTNSLILSVLNYNNNYLNVVFEKSISTRIGDGLHSEGEINTAAYTRTKIAIIETLSNMKKQGINFDGNLGICTEAMRAARNGNEILKRLRSDTKINFELISGKDEARFSFLACSQYAKAYKNAIIADIGGGSTELNFISDMRLSSSVSIPIGAVQLESLLGISKSPQSMEPAKKMIDYSLGLYNFNNNILIFCGGTATTLAIIKLGLQKYVPSKVEGLKITHGEIKDLLNTLGKNNISEIKKLLNYDPKRADIITAGTCIMERIFDKFNTQEALITTMGPRHGYFMESCKIRGIDGIHYAEKG